MSIQYPSASSLRLHKTDFTNKQVATLRPSVLYSLFPLQLRSLTCQQVFSTCSLTTVKQCGIKRELSLDRWFDHSFMLCELLTLSRPRLWAAAALWWIMFAYGRSFAGRFCISGSQQCEVRKSPGRAATLRNVQHWETHEDGIWKQHETHRSLKRRRRPEASRKPELKSTRTTTTKVLNASTAPVCPGEASQGSFTIRAPHMQAQGSGAGRRSAWLQGHTQCFLTDSLTNSSKCKVDPFQTLRYFLSADIWDMLTWIQWRLNVYLLSLDKIRKWNSIKNHKHELIEEFHFNLRFIWTWM